MEASFLPPAIANATVRRVDCIQSSCLSVCDYHASVYTALGMLLHVLASRLPNITATVSKLSVSWILWPSSDSTVQISTVSYDAKLVVEKVFPCLDLELSHRVHLPIHRHARTMEKTFVTAFGVIRRALERFQGTHWLTLSL